MLNVRLLYVLRPAEYSKVVLYNHSNSWTFICKGPATKVFTKTGFHKNTKILRLPRKIHFCATSVVETEINILLGEMF